MTKTIRRYLSIALKGFAMGMADVVPGVSGGTIAFITGIYQEWVESIKAFTDPPNLKLILTFRWREAARVLPWPFLTALGAGIATAILTFAKALTWALKTHPDFVWAFFFGLVFASVWLIFKEVRLWTVATGVAVAISAVIAYTLVGLTPIEPPDTWWFLMLSGAVAICAMVLPGISGAFILVLLGKYRVVLEAVVERDMATIVLFGTGCLAGIVTFARAVSYFFKRHPDMTLAVLTGLMAGSLRKIWPWKETLSTTVNRHGETVPLFQINILPPQLDGTALITLLLMLAGMGVVIWIGRRPPGLTPQ